MTAHPPIRGAAGLTALMFPGQGSQHHEMGADVRNWMPELADLLEVLVGADPFARLDEGTHVVQPALFCADVAAWTALSHHGVMADLVVGHSLGDFAALVAAGALDACEGLRLVAARGEIAERVASREPGGMLALLGATHAQAVELAAGWGLHLANDNSPSQFVLAGDREVFAQARAESRRLGLRAVELAVKGAFHCPAMSAAVAPFKEVLDTIGFREPSLPAYSSVTAQLFDDVPRRLAEGLTTTVRWRELMSALHRLNVRRFIEAGPGEVLTRLVRRTLPDVLALPFTEAFGDGAGELRFRGAVPAVGRVPLPLNLPVISS